MNTTRFNKYYKQTPHFKYTNPNPTADARKTMVWDKSDCAIRALALATGAEWLTAFDFLAGKARRDFSTISDAHLFRNWYEENGGVWYGVKAEKGQKRMTCLDFAKTHPTGRYILRIAHHECACVDGVILDTWNTADKTIYGYVDMNNFSF